VGFNEFLKKVTAADDAGFFQTEWKVRISLNDKDPKSASVKKAFEADLKKVLDKYSDKVLEKDGKYNGSASSHPILA